MFYFQFDCAGHRATRSLKRASLKDSNMQLLGIVDVLFGTYFEAKLDDMP